MTLIIKNAQIIGGEGKFPPKLDVFVNDDKISAIGLFPNKRADLIIDGQGCCLLPGFIDVRNDADHYLDIFDDSSQENLLRDGITTVIGGHCGASLAPLIYGTLESVRKWADISKINVNWHSVDEFLELLERKPLGVNFGTLIGHSTVRRALVGDNQRDLTKNEIKVFEKVIEDGLKEGAFGFSIGLGYVHGRKVPRPEIKTLSRIVAKYKSVYSVHLRKEGGEIRDSVRENIKIAKETGVKTLISHFLPVLSFEKEYESALGDIQNLGNEYNFHFDVYPFPVTCVSLYTFLPEWAQDRNLETMIEKLKNRWLLPKIVSDLPDISPKDFIIGRAPANKPLEGLTLQEFMEFYSIKDSKKALVKLMIATKLQSVIFHKNVNLDLLKSALKDRHSLIASGALDLKKLKQEAKGAFSAFLEMAKQENLMPFEDAVKKITWEPSKKFNIAKRGVIKEGYFADFVGFKDGEVKFVVVNGRLAFKDGVFEKNLAGRPLRHF